MRFPVFSAPVDPAVDPPLCRKSRSYVQSLLTTGAARLINPHDFKAGVQLLGRIAPSIFEQLGIGNLLPFTRVLDPLKRPPRLHYPIPAVGAHGRLLRCKDVNYIAEADAVVAVAS